MDAMKIPHILLTGSEEEKARMESILEAMGKERPALGQDCTLAFGEESLPRHAPATFDKEGRIITVRASLSGSEAATAIKAHLKLARQMEEKPENQQSPKIKSGPNALKTR